MYVHNRCFVNIVCNFERLLKILADSDSEFKQFQGSVNISIYQVPEQTRAIEGLVIEGAKMGGAKLTVF